MWSWTFGVLLGVLATSMGQDCDCQIHTVQDLYNSYDVVFVGFGRQAGDDFSANVLWSAKGCYKKNTKLTLLSHATCRMSAPLTGVNALFAGNVYTYPNGTSTLVLDSCVQKWNLAVEDVDVADLTWLGKQPLTCPAGPAGSNLTVTTCAGGAKPLSCRPCRSVSKCGELEGCQRNPCDSCNSRVEEHGQITCGTQGGAAAEAKCPKCAVDPCQYASKTSLRDAGCQQWKQARRCVADPCQGCDRVRWLDAKGQQVCPGASAVDRCFDWARVELDTTTCIFPEVQGYAIMGGACSAVKSCGEPQGSLPLFPSLEACTEACHCQDLKDLQVSVNSAGESCDDVLGYSVQGGQCSELRGCKATFVLAGVQMHLHGTQLSCARTCAAHLKPYEIVRGRPSDWVEATHSNDVDPKQHYETVFPANRVQRIDIVIAPEDYEAMERDLTQISEDYMVQLEEQKAQRKEEDEEESEISDRLSGLDEDEDEEDKKSKKKKKKKKKSSDLFKDIMRMQLVSELSAGGQGGGPNPLMLALAGGGGDSESLAALLEKGVMRRQANYAELGIPQQQPTFVLAGVQPMTMLPQGLGGQVGYAQPQLTQVTYGADGAAYYGGNEAFYGGNEAFYGGNEAFYGGNEAFYGGNEAFYGGDEAFYGGDEAFYGDDRAFNGEDIVDENPMQDMLAKIMQERGEKKQAKKLRSQWASIPPRDRGIFLPRDVEYVPCTVKFRGSTWHKVGFRYKGKSSLISSFQGGSLKRGIRLNFDKFEDDFPEIKNQRFFGFDALTFSGMAADDAFMREMLASEIFTAAGLPAARVTMTTVYVDVGTGPQYWGLYAMVEDPTDAMRLPGDSKDGDGNFYKPEHNTWARFVAGDFTKKNNKKENNFTDIEEAIAAVNSAERNFNRTAWSQRLEQVLDVNSFLTFLATSAAISNWDSYGVMPHNYYLYNLNDKLTWIPWDHNMVLKDDPRETTIMQDDITSVWPLTRNLLDDPVYRAHYVNVMKWLVEEGPLESSRLKARGNQLLEMVKPYVVGDKAAGIEGESWPNALFRDVPAAFAKGVKDLNEYIKSRPGKIQKALKKELDTDDD